MSYYERNSPWLAIFCTICGREHKGLFAWHGKVCGTRCFRELEWRRACAIVGKGYKPDPEAIEGHWCVRYTLRCDRRTDGPFLSASEAREYVAKLAAEPGIADIILLPRTWQPEDVSPKPPPPIPDP